MPVIRQLQVEALREEFAEPTRERQRFERIARICAALDRRRENAQEWRARQADELAAAKLLQVPQVDTRATKVRTEEMAAVVKGD
jgi:hypothetical protein